MHDVSVFLATWVAPILTGVFCAVLPALLASLKPNKGEHHD